MIDKPVVIRRWLDNKEISWAPARIFGLLTRFHDIPQGAPVSGWELDFFGRGIGGGDVGEGIFSRREKREGTRRNWGRNGGGAGPARFDDGGGMAEEMRA